MAKNPDPQTPLSNVKGTTRTLDDWLTTSHLCLVALPTWPEAARYVGLGRRAFDVFRESDCKTAFLVTGDDTAARRILGDEAMSRYIVFLDPESAFVKAAGLTHLPAFVHVRADCTVAAAAEGWDPPEWQSVANSVGKAMRWSKPIYPMSGDPIPFEGWDT